MTDYDRWKLATPDYLEEDDEEDGVSDDESDTEGE